ncbi:MAG: ABC-F family ATP-binding cassette domain-containing protein, partial [Chloroflexota bacterium]
QPVLLTAQRYSIADCLSATNRVTICLTVSENKIMILTNLDNIAITYISTPIFTNLSWEIHDGRCAGLVGPNGCGKSSLMKLIAGELTSDTGYVVRSSGLTVGYLTQEPQLTAGRTVWEEAVTAHTVLHEIEEQLAVIDLELGDPDVYGDEETLNRVLAEQERLLQQYADEGGPAYEGRVRSTLAQLGFETEAKRALPVDILSGGQKKLVGLAKLLVTQPKLLLLDEPDNHLDIEGKHFLEQLIRNYDGGVIIVSHDRYLLDLVADEIMELEDGKLTRYIGNYSEYAFEKQNNLLRQQQLFQAQAKEINRLEQSAKRLMMWGRVYDNVKFIRRAQSMMKRIDKIDRIDKPIIDRKRMDLELSGWRGSNKVLSITDLDRVFVDEASGDENIVLMGLDLLIWRGERIGLVGPNGAGKSVLFRLILEQDEPTSGDITIGPSVTTGYYAQEHESLVYNQTLLDTIRNTVPMTESTAVSFLGKFLFNYQQVRGPVSELSGGERSRLQMALLMLSNANFLLLDEPTNNLDIPSAEVLEEALAEFNGTVLVISHDRYFLDRVVDRIVELDNGVLTEYTGGYSDYQEQKRKS